MADRAHDHRHDHGHSHDHGLSHAHVHAPVDFGQAFAIGIGLNLGFVAIETVFGFLANSMSLLADAGHNLSDVLGLVVAWAGAVMARRAASPRFTYGLKKAPILGYYIGLGSAQEGEMFDVMCYLHESAVDDAGKLQKGQDVKLMGIQKGG